MVVVCMETFGRNCAWPGSAETRAQLALWAIKKARGRTRLSDLGLFGYVAVRDLRWIPFNVGESLAQVVAHISTKIF